MAPGPFAALHVIEGGLSKRVLFVPGSWVGTGIQVRWGGCGGGGWVPLNPQHEAQCPAAQVESWSCRFGHIISHVLMGEC